MLNRRTFILAGGGALLLGDAAAGTSQAVPATGERVSLLTPTEQLMYSAVRLVCQTPRFVRSGTGFLFSLFGTKDLNVPVIVTNRHVVEGWGHCAFNLARQLPDGSPDLGHHVPIEWTEFKTAWLPHPDCDLVIIPIAQVLAGLQRQGTTPFVVTLDPSLIPTEEELKSLTPVEQILTVGFPGQLWDEVHNLPLFHRGFTSTPAYVDFQGRKEFLIDIATWPGASGSAVLLYNEGFWVNRNGGTEVGGIRAKLLGVVYGVAVQDVSGNVLIQKAPTQVAAASIAVPTNLGACIKASRILEFEPLLVSKGLVKPPAGYTMRER